ncbi:hypothetical protein EDD27_9168 [Nonomuraea polychroma]|uniref:WD40 repeat protein n=1 Tax=Nonomuraea polychroma TaxID=46176 RepID=A0A438MKR0_9ACTN|nr:hypothetical protein [Nonomuraea polychroma]RVX46293.1 hypothetical protein EDD27_9168 [Nonomuraea polychroma]
MSTEELVKDALGAVADQARLPTGVAQAAWRQRTRMRIRRAATTAAALVAAVTVGVITVPSLVAREDPEVATSRIGGDTAADPGRSTPVERVAAGRVTLTAYASCEHSCSWYLLTHAGTGGYTHGRWGWIDVAPSGRTAAVLEETLPARRIGLVDTTAARLRRWIDLGRAVAGRVAWSPDGKRLLVTTYDHVPGLLADPAGEPDTRQVRTGFAIVDVNSGKATFHDLPGDPDSAGLRNDLLWSRDGSLIWENTGARQEPRKYYDLTGRSRPGPAQESSSDQPAGLSPNGSRLAMGGRSGSAPFVVDVDSGDTTLLEPPGDHVIVQSLAWADDTHLIAWAQDRATADSSKSRYRLVLVDVTGKQEVTPLTGWTGTLSRPNWMPVLTTEP